MKGVRCGSETAVGWTGPTRILAGGRVRWPAGYLCKCLLLAAPPLDLCGGYHVSYQPFLFYQPTIAARPPLLHTCHHTSTAIPDTFSPQPSMFVPCLPGLHQFFLMAAVPATGPSLLQATGYPTKSRYCHLISSHEPSPAPKDSKGGFCGIACRATEGLITPFSKLNPSY